MTGATPPLAGPPNRHVRAGRGRRVLLAVAVAVLVVVAGYAAYAAIEARPPPGTTPLVVYTYSSFYGGSCSISPALAAALAPFESLHHVTVDLECPSDLLTTLSNERSAPHADLVVGLDEVTAPEALADGLIAPYVSPELAHVPTSVANELDPAHGIAPYEWGYLAIDYTPAFYNATGGAVARSSFANFTDNSTWHAGLLSENPTTDIVGEEFLLWEIEFSEAVLHQNWTTWWSQGGATLPSAVDWSTAFQEFSDDPVTYPMVVSYTTDAAYATANGAPGSIGTAVTTWNGTEYGWRTVYGAAVVAGAAHATLATELIDWLLEGPVQTGLPLDEWEYPANTTTPLPSAFASAPDPSQIVPLDDYTTPAAIAHWLPYYLDQWQTIASG